jgi:Fuc2NAc and GlcNAc transferase
LASGFLLALSAFGLGVLGAAIISRHAKRFGLLDNPNARSSHARVTPKGGGVGILGVVVFLAPFLGVSAWIWIPASLVSVVSFFGDRIHLGQKMRLAVQFGCAFACLAGLWNSLEATTGLRLWFLVPLCLFLAVYIVGTANYYNFMDGINGIAGLTGAVAFSGLALHAGWIKGWAMDGNALLALCVACACLGFLPLNFPVARVFMGDVGSILLGFLFAVLAIRQSATLLDFVFLNSLLVPFYADEWTTLSVRVRAKQNLMLAHRRHVYQILVNQIGVAHWKISMLYAILQIAIALVSWSLRLVGMWAVVVWLVLVFGLFLVVDKSVRRYE